MVIKLMKRWFGSETVYNEKYFESKIRFYDRKINTNFHDHGAPKGNFHCVCLSMVLIDSVFKTGKSYYTQVLLEECKYVVK